MCATNPLSLHLLLHANSNPPSLPPLPKTRHLPKPFTFHTTPLSQQPSPIKTLHLPFIKFFQKPLTFAKPFRIHFITPTRNLHTNIITMTNFTEATPSKSQASNSPLPSQNLDLLQTDTNE